MNTFSVKIRIDSNKDLHEFGDRAAAFDWVRQTQKGRLILSVLSYEGEQLEDLTRWYYNGQFFKKEDLSS